MSASILKATLRAIALFCASPVPAGEIRFSREILPLLSDNCFHCHGPDEKARKAHLRLDTQEGAFSTNKEGRSAIVPGNNARSELLARILNPDPEEVMPPPDSHKSLKPEQVQLLKAWIDAGAAWGKHWAFEKPVRPAVSQTDGQSEIDALVGKGLLREGLHPAPEAAKETLVRRVSLDLTGLPPTAEEAAAFLSDTSAQAYEKLVDRLLTSPHFGERMAWDWLDAARYADSNGYQGDSERTMWPWRDWVVSAFNRNLPFDQFTVWQLAGDLIPGATDEQRLATGFFRNHMINGEGGRIPEENRIDYGFDMTETYGTVWLGLTFNCCRCHDHKFDPLSRREYYQLFAFFNQTPVDGSGGDPQSPPNLEVLSPEGRKQLDALDASLGEIDGRIAERRKSISANQQQWEAKLREKGGASGRWQTLDPSEFRAEHQTLTKQKDFSLLAGGENPDKDTYTITCRLQDAAPLQARALRLEALRDPSMTLGGLGRSDSGNFVLTEIEIQVRSAPEAPPQSVKIAGALATFEQNGFKVTGTFDGKPDTGWAVWPGKPIDRDHEAVFHFAAPVELTPQSLVTVVLRHDSGHKSHHLGRFRISLTTVENAPLTDDAQRLSAALQRSAENRSPEEAKLVADSFAASDGLLKSLQVEREKTQREAAAIRKGAPRVMVMQDRPERRDTFMLNHGLYDKPEDKVEAAVPASLHGFPKAAPHNRLGLAQWTVSPDNPLTARVVVNRFWQQIFGIGLVKTPEDFGIQGERPLQQDLLDWLAVEFVQSGWDVKKLLRRIVTSRTYRQDSRVPPGMAERDPDNRHLARGPRFRMPSWMLRDQALAASGLLAAKQGGPAVNTYQPEGIWEEATFGNKTFQLGTGEDLYRRSLYTFWRRIIAPAMFFDNASRQTCTVKVFRTNTPLQALLTLNDIPYVESARKLAEHTLHGTTDPDAGICFAFRSMLLRSPNNEELAIMKTALERQTAQFRANPGEAAKLLATGASQRDEKLDPVALAAWTQLCLSLLNLDETVTKE